MSDDQDGDEPIILSDQQLEVVSGGGAMVMFGPGSSGVHIVLDGKPVTAAAD